MKATVIVDNIADCGLTGEWGLCIYIEYNGKNILLDTGQSAMFLKNMQKLGINPENVDFAVLSHAHYDHADGMKTFFTHNSKAKFYLRSGSGENCYKQGRIFKKYIGINKGTLKKYSDRIVFAQGDSTLADGVTLVPHKTEHLDELGKKAQMFVKVNGRYSYDNFAHEQSLVFDTDKGLVIFNSCSHGGADNIINEVSKTYPNKNIYALIGGFHLFKTSDEGVKALAQRIKDTGIQKIYTGHCTGERAFQILHEELGDTAVQLKTGMIMEF